MSKDSKITISWLSHPHKLFATEPMDTKITSKNETTEEPVEKKKTSKNEITKEPTEKKKRAKNEKTEKLQTPDEKTKVHTEKDEMLEMLKTNIELFEMTEKLAKFVADMGELGLV